MHTHLPHLQQVYIVRTVMPLYQISSTYLCHPLPSCQVSYTHRHTHTQYSQLSQ